MTPSDVYSLNIQLLNDCKSRSTLHFDPWDKRLKMHCFRCIDIFIFLPSPSLHFYTSLKRLCHAAITSLTVHGEYCFIKVACLLALYIKRARANIILLWIFMGTKRLLLEYFAYFTILYLFIYLSIECAKYNKNNSCFHIPCYFSW